MPRSLDLRVLCLGVVALAAVTFDHPSAYHPATKATRIDGGRIQIETGMIVPETCWSVASAEAGSPAGIEPVAGAAAATVRLARAGETCAPAMTPLKTAFTIAGDRNTRSIMLYVTDADGRLMKAERKLVRG